MSVGTQRRLTTIVAADIAGFSRLVGIDEEDTLAAQRNHRNELIEPLLSKYQGRIANTAGDSFLFEFPSAVEAVRCSVAIQHGMAERNRDVAADRRIEYRIGINVGDVMADGDDLLGDGVNIAARLEGICEPGGIILSDNAYQQVRDRLEINWQDGGKHEIKNIARPVQVWRWGAATGEATETNETEPLLLPTKPSIVVLPFNNMSGDVEQEYFADGITEDITTELSRFEQLFVIARNTAFTYKNKSIRITDVARELGVHFVLEGSVRKAGNQVRINAQLIDGQSGNHLWAERFDGGIEQIFELQDEVTRQVVTAVVPQINAAQLARMARGEQLFDEAHDIAWRAYSEFGEATRLSEPIRLRAAIAKAYEAIALNKRCHPAYGVICASLWHELLHRWTDTPEQSLAELERVADTFVLLWPKSHLAHFHHGMANFLANRVEAAAQDYKHSTELNANDAMVLAMLANAEVNIGNLAEAKVVAEKAIRLNPNGQWAGAACLALAQAAYIEDDGKFRHWAEKAIRAQPNAPVRRALMVAYAAEIGDEQLLEQHLLHLKKIAPRFITDILNGKTQVGWGANSRTVERYINALRKAVPME